MRAIDTNVLVRMVSRDNPHQTRVAEDFIRGGAWVSVLALTEAIWVLAAVYNRNAVELGDAIEMLLHHESLIVEDADVVEAALGLYRKKPSLGFSDCLLLQLATKAGHLPLGTFDRALARVAGTQKL